MHFGHSHAIIYFINLQTKKTIQSDPMPTFHMLNGSSFHIGQSIVEVSYTATSYPFLTGCSKLSQWCKHHRCTTSRGLPIYRITGEKCLNTSHIPVPQHFLGSFAGLTSTVGVFHCAMFWSFLTTWIEANLTNPPLPKTQENMRRQTPPGIFSWFRHCDESLYYCKCPFFLWTWDFKLGMFQNFSGVFRAGKIEVSLLKAPHLKPKKSI